MVSKPIRNAQILVERQSALLYQCRNIIADLERDFAEAAKEDGGSEGDGEGEDGS